MAAYAVEEPAKAVVAASSSRARTESGASKASSGPPAPPPLPVQVEEQQVEVVEEQVQELPAVVVQRTPEEEAALVEQQMMFLQLWRDYYMSYFTAMNLPCPPEAEAAAAAAAAALASAGTTPGAFTGGDPAEAIATLTAFIQQGDLQSQNDGASSIMEDHQEAFLLWRRSLGDLGSEREARLLSTLSRDRLAVRAAAAAAAAVQQHQQQGVTPVAGPKDVDVDAPPVSPSVVSSDMNTVILHSVASWTSTDDEDEASVAPPSAAPSLAAPTPLRSPGSATALPALSTLSTLSRDRLSALSRERLSTPSLSPRPLSLVAAQRMAARNPSPPPSAVGSDTGTVILHSVVSWSGSEEESATTLSSTQATKATMVHTKTPVALNPVFPASWTGAPKELAIGNSYVAYEDSHPSDRHRPVAYLVPGIGDFRHSFRFLGPKLVDGGYRVIAQDMRGVGESGTEFTSYNIEDVASDVVAVLDAEGITEPVALICNSLSAAAAITIAAEHPERVRAIVTLGGFFRDMPGDAYFRPVSYLLFNHLWGQPMWTSAFLSFFASKPDDIDAYVAAVKAKMLSDCNHADVIGMMIRATKEHAWSKIGQVKVPVMLVMGEKDPDFKNPEEETDYVKSSLTASTLVEKLMVADAGHYPHVEKPNLVAPRIVEFLEAI
ncbi:hypothetical protein HDU96_008411 [Phlyctochytrium bullatum]|nr:hypothetical protein HDU96_008411 [Phlyctochytrium bullatum]